jgi:hypothetical protein
MTGFDSHYTRHTLRTILSEGQCLFPRLYRSIYTTEVRDNIRQARNDHRKALLGRRNSLTVEELKTLRTAVNDLYDATTDLLLNEISRYLGDLTAYTSKDTA